VRTIERRYTVLDVFTDVPLTGNQLAVVHDADGLDDDLMLAFARETKLAETTFVQSSVEPGADYRNRIFCMLGEMPFAGHPSLGTAVAVGRRRDVSGHASYVQQTGAGLQPIDVEIGPDRLTASMLQEPPVFGPEVDPEPLMRALGLTPQDAHPTLLPQLVTTGLQHVMVPLATSDAVGRIRSVPETVDALLAEHSAFGVYAAWCEPERGTARTRMFARSDQILEDPATGSAAGPLCAYLHERTGCAVLDIVQGVEIGRRSELHAEVAGDSVRVGGASVVVADGVVYL
jgi:trans-2,3-dihydro-3-hydroxyanthranilate isomerase